MNRKQNGPSHFRLASRDVSVEKRRLSSTVLSIVLMMSVLTTSTIVSVREYNAQAPFAETSEVEFRSSAARPFSSVLNPDGSVRRGAYDPKGFRMAYGPKSEPRFLPPDGGDLLSTPTSCNDGWHAGVSVSGVGGHITAIAIDAAGGIYVGGYFTVAGNTLVNRIAKWDGSNWAPLGSGVNGFVNAIAISGTDVYVGGNFTMAGGTPANYIARWDGSGWSALGSGPEGIVLDIEVSGTDIYVGGGGSNNGTPTGYVATWNGTNWANLGSEMDHFVWDVAVSGTDVYAGGGFTMAGPTDAGHVAKWDGLTWSPMGSGTNGEVFTVAVSGKDIYAGGSFTTAGGTSANHIAKWDGSSWSALGSGMAGGSDSTSVTQIDISGSDIFVGGRFTTAGGTAANHIAKWNGSSWSAMDSGIPYVVEPGYSLVGAMAVSGSDVYVGGNSQLAKWNGSSWSAVGSGAISKVSTLTVSGNEVYAGGFFTAEDGFTYSNAAKWNGTSWTPLGSRPSDPFGIQRSVNDITVSGSNVYIGGSFGGGHPHRLDGYVYEWDGSNWSELPGMDNQVHAVAAIGPDLYAGGWFRNAGGTPASGIAKWNGSSWSDVGLLENGAVYALAVSGTDLYAGGDFYNAGGVEAAYVAKWNGSNWSALGPGPFARHTQNMPDDFFSAVTDIEVVGQNVFIGGGLNGDYGGGYGVVAKWDGSNWTIAPQLCCERVTDIGVSGSDVYAGGPFSIADGKPVIGGIARWDGIGWSSLGSGVSGEVTTIEVLGTEVFVGGTFSTAGCHVSPYFARYTIPSASISGRVMTNVGQGLRNAVVTLTDANGFRRSVVTSTLGYFQFDNVATGNIYVVGAVSKRYRFTPRQLEVNGSLTDVDLIGQE